jgi:hypothetical protein
LGAVCPSGGEPGADLDDAANDQQSDRCVQSERQQQRRRGQAKYRDQHVDHDEPPKQAQQPWQSTFSLQTLKI